MEMNFVHNLLYNPHKKNKINDSDSNSGNFEKGKSTNKQSIKEGSFE